MGYNLHFAPDEGHPQSFAAYDAERGLPPDPDGDYYDNPAYLHNRVYDGQPQAIIDALRIIVNYTYFTVPAKHRIDEMDEVLHQAAQLIAFDHPECRPKT